MKCRVDGLLSMWPAAGAGLVMTCLLLSAVWAQEPGKPAAPPAAAADEGAAKKDAADEGAAKKELSKAEKLKEAQDAFAGVIDASAIDLTPGPVDERLKAFYKELGVDGGGFYTWQGRTYMIATGEVTLTTEIAKPGWLTRRILAFNEAELRARSAMAKAIKQGITSKQLFERFDGYSPTVAEQLQALKGGAASADYYEEATAVFASAQVMGAVVCKTIEGENRKDEYKVVQVLVWSPKLRELAMNALADLDYCLPREKLGKEDVEQVPSEEAELVKEIGCKVYLNKRGQRYYVAYAQAEPMVRSKSGVARAVDIAKSRAETMANGYLARALAADVSSVSLDEMARLFEEQQEGKTEEKLVGGFYERMQSVAQGLTLSGVITKKTWAFTHPTWGIPVAGAVVIWSPEAKSVIRELGLDKRVDLSPDNLAAYLVRKYGKPESPPVPGTKRKPGPGKPGLQESKPAKKLTF